MDKTIIDRWLYESEGDALDFKREQYKFIGASNVEKSELLKDILAMANSWRNVDAYIVIGVEDRAEKPNILHGIEEHIDDAKIQQFVNSKVAGQCRFQYITYTIQEKTLGIIRIPCQERPIFLKQDYGSLKAETVYVRRGSSTEIAKPDEISKMGKTFTNIITPNIDIGFYNKNTGTLLGNEISFNGSYLNIIDTIPDYSGSNIPYMGYINSNRDYYRNLIDYINFSNSYLPIKLAIRNNGEIEVLNVQLEFNIYVSEVDIVLDGSEVPEPDTNYQPPRIDYGSSYNIEILDNMYKASNHIERLHAKRTLAFDGQIYLQSKESKTINSKAIVYVDGQSKPYEKEILIDIHMSKKSLSWKNSMRGYQSNIQF